MTVDIRHANISFDQGSGIFAPSTCARHLYVLSKDEAQERLPEGLLAMPGAEVRTGTDAYETLLLFACGLRSDKVGEYHVTSQLKEGWSEFKRSQPDQARRLESLMNGLFQDVKLIRTELVGRIADISTELAARSAAKISGGETVLVIGEKPGITESIMLALGRQKKKHVGRILITHPDDSAASSLFDDAKRLKEEARLQPGVVITRLSFADALNEMRTGRSAGDDGAGFSHVFCCAPLLEEQTDRQIAQAWNARQEPAKHGLLITLKGRPRDRNATPDFWKGLGLRNWVSVEDLNLRVNVVASRNKALIAAAHRACLLCADARVQKVPHRELVGQVREQTNGFPAHAT